jgi:anti-sigma B factor antagonist
MDTELEVRDEVTILRVRGEIDIATAPILQEALARLDPEEGMAVVDLSSVTFMGSIGLNALLFCRQRYVDAGHAERLRLVVTRTATTRIFESTGLANVFLFSPSVDDALAQT